MEKLRSHMKVGLAGGTSSCCALLLAVALDWFTGLPLHYGVFVAPMVWAALLYTVAVGVRVRGRQGTSLTQLERGAVGANCVSTNRAARWSKRGRGAIIKSAVFLSHEGVRPVRRPSREGVFV